MSNVRVSVNAVEMDASIDGEEIWESVFEQVGDVVKESAWDAVSEQVRETIGDEAWAIVAPHVRETTAEAATNIVREEAWDVVSGQVKEMIGEEAWDAVSYSVESFCDDYIPNCVADAVDDAHDDQNISEVITSLLGDFNRTSRFGLCSLGEAFQDAVETATSNIAKNKGASEEETDPVAPSYRTAIEVLERRMARLETLLRRFGEDVDDQMGTNAHPQVVSTEPF